MKIALIDPSLFTWPYDNALSLALEQNGHQAAVFGKHVMPGEIPGAARSLRPLFYRGFETPRMQSLPTGVFLALKGLSHPLSLVKLLAALMRFKPDVIHFQWVPLPIMDRLFIGAFKRIAPVILTVHDSVPFNGNPRSKLQRLSAIAIMRRFDRLIVHTGQAQKRLIAYGLKEERIAHIPHGVMESHRADEAPPSAPVTRSDNTAVLLLFGKLKPYKGADILIRAVAAMPAATRARCRVRIVGKAYMDVEPLHALANELKVEGHILWDLRFIEETEIGTILRQSDIMVMPYREIDASGVLMDALAAGRPIVASRIGIFAEVLEDGKHGYLVPPEDPQALAAALTMLADDPSLRRAMGEQVSALQDALPGWREVACRTEALYRQALLERTGIP